MRRMIRVSAAVRAQSGSFKTSSKTLRLIIPKRSCGGQIR